MSNIKNSLLIEFVSEELPPIKLDENIAKPFSDSVIEQLKGFLEDNYQVKRFVAPRRFGVVIDGINFKEDNHQLRKKGPAINSALVENEPTKALLGFAKSCGIDWHDLERGTDGYFYFTTIINGKTLDSIIGETIANALKKIHIAKAMRWGDKDYQFVRPLHNLVVMFNEQVIECNVMGLIASNQTFGHRFLTNNKIILNHANSYFLDMQNLAKVIPNFEDRKLIVVNQLMEIAKELDLEISHVDGLVDEVVGLVEYPEVLVGTFDEKFLQVPQECLILSMAKNQKYFALVNHEAKLANKFLFVTNIKSINSQVIIDGNEKVLAARLSDAEFFYNFDKRTKLEDFVPKMSAVVYHNKLGSQLERIVRLQKIAEKIAPMLQVDTNLAKRTAYLLKADLATEMVGEFPELQGIMGRYYAISSGEDINIANAIEQHYYPRFSGDSIPNTQLGKVVALTDKLEVLVGIWGIGLVPSGDKDPYALRRAALGVIRILLDNKLDIKQLLQLTIDGFAGKNLLPTLKEDLYAFILNRLANYLTTIEGYPVKVVSAALGSKNLDLSEVKDVCDILSCWYNNSQAVTNGLLLSLNKRVENILTKNKDAINLDFSLDTKLFQYKEEHDLYQAYQLFMQGNYLTIHDYFNGLTQLFAGVLESFFANVMVIDDNYAIRQNRLSLLCSLYDKFNYYAKLSELV